MVASSNSVESIGKSRGGNTTKIHMAVDSYCLLIEFILTGGEVHNSKAAPDLIANLPTSDYVIVDKGYDSESIREIIRQKNPYPLYPERKIQKRVIQIWIGVCISTGIWLKMSFHD